MSTKKSGQQPFWLGGAAASMAACVTHPLDRTKYAMQVQSIAERQPMLRSIYIFASRDGIRSLWSGLSASILRQTTYSTARFALYDFFSSRVQKQTGRKPTGVSTIMCSALSGGLAGMVGNPSEIVLVRMCSDGVKDASQRYYYRNAFSGLIRIGQEEGMRTFYKGLLPNVIRSVIMNVSQIAVYTDVKRRMLSSQILDLKDGVPVHISASLVAGLAATTACAPADVLKSKIQSANGKGQSIMNILSTNLKAEGPAFLMKGWTPAFLRLGPNTVLMFLFYEQLQRLLARDII